MNTFLMKIGVLMTSFLLVGCQSEVPPVSIQPTPETSTTTNKNEANTDTVPPTVTAEGSISETEAKQIALNHAGVAEAQAQFMKVKLDYDDGVPEYEVEFYVDNMEYDYEIHAVTGEIRSIDHDMETPRPNTNGSTNSGVGNISEAEAKQIALNHAGVVEAQAQFMKVKLDYDDGVPEYEVEFYVDNMEYDYEIHAVTGEIRSFDHDMETQRPNTNNPTNSGAGNISEAEAKQIALNHADIREAEAQFVKVKLDYDDGVPEYEVEFYVGNMEYDYEIHAVTGEILSHERELDD